MKKLLAILLAVVMTVAVFAACGSNDAADNSPTDNAPVEADETASDEQQDQQSDAGMSLEDIREKGEFVVGLDDTFAPMGFRDTDGELVGFDIDLATALGEHLDIEVRFQPISWDAKEMELETGQIDCIWNGLSVTPLREEELSLSKPYLANHMVVMTNEGVTINSKEELVDYQIGIQSGSAALEAVMNDEIYESIADNIVDYPTYDEVILDMQAGRLDCMVIDEVFGDYKNNQMDNIYGKVTGFDFGEDLYAIGFRKADTTLTDEINEAIAELIEAGKVQEISEKWFGVNIVLE